MLAVARKRILRLSSFTLVELLVVMFIIALLVAILLQASQGVMGSAARSRARGEIKAMETGIEAYKIDNATYPLTNTFSSTNAYSTVDPTAANYYQSSQTLYEALTGRTNFLDTPVVGVKSYMTFRVSQLANIKTPAGTAIGPSSTYIQDPFGYSYGYYTGDTNSPQLTPPVNGTGFYDLWSTGGVLSSQITANPAAINGWISNWTQ